MKHDLESYLKNNMERSVVLVKPDGLQRGLVGEIIHRFERKGLRLAGIKMVSLSDAILDEWYAHHKDKSFFPKLKAYMKSYPVIAMLWEGLESVSTIRRMLGVTKARDAEPGTIRGDFAMSQQYNLMHASENAEVARKEEALIFDPAEIFSYDLADFDYVYLDEERNK